MARKFENTKHLVKYMEQMNFWRTFTKKPLLKLPLKQDEINEIADRIDCDLSPENLCCDGEIRGAEVNRRYNLFTKAFAELKAYASTKGLSITVKTYEIS